MSPHYLCKQRIKQIESMRRIFSLFLAASLLIALGHTETTNAQSKMDINEELQKNDPELHAILQNFAFGETLQYGNKVDAKTTAMVRLVSCIALQAQAQYKSMLESAWQAGVSPVEIKEILYQAVPYAGMAKVMDFVSITNEFLTGKGVKLPLDGQSTTTTANRFEKGLATQKGIFGASIDAMRSNAPDNQKNIQDYLSANCFGDYYTRTGVDVKTREVLTFAILISMGGCEPQVKGHIQGNLNVGNDKEYLLEVVTRLLPLIGYPRTLNAITCLNEVAPEPKTTAASNGK
jgi:4-carboxymuconolactone decarboxylase